MYKHLDSLLEKAKKKLRISFNRLGVMGFDELNVVNTKKTTQEMFDRFLADNETMYLKAARKAYTTAVGEGKASEIDVDWVAGFLVSYNLVTGYLYDKEAERKRLRLNEQILTAREYGDRQLFNDSLRRTANLWWTQTSQYGIDVVDKATLKAYRDKGVKWVRWVTANDEKTCVDCRDRDGKVYRINAVPSKTHYGCRCYVVPTSREE